MSQGKQMNEFKKMIEELKTWKTDESQIKDWFLVHVLGYLVSNWYLKTFKLSIKVKEWRKKH
jgi:hypothetical protein